MNNAVSRAAPLDELTCKSDDLKNHRQPGSQPACMDELTHALRQPLSTIESLAYYLEITSADDQLCRHLRQIRLMVDRASRILDHAAA
jgi:nitrogen-specific signal transduction histidine kinase